MHGRLWLLFGGIGVLLVGGAGVAVSLRLRDQAAQSPYVDQLASPVRGLSAQEVADLIEGRGAGYARTAELNNYPGPRHVLDLGDQLRLSAQQTAQIQTAFHAIDQEAERLGALIVERERQFSSAFASGTITASDVQAQTDALAELYAELRAVHLQAHLAITPLLSPDQIAAYNDLRGYSGDAPADQHQHQN